ncbi:MAG: hydroxypyruvate isomerase [SAR202 cluster bacterium]|nr:hydroxypyruvate isomerase [SAR202 cluster bacterium]|tara:strand:+ start:5623 stop:6402 length:780 start_codon:yes stop_codon:yes gene_type:complete
MIKFSANLSMLFTELDFLDRFAAAKKAGFDYVEYLFPYDFSPDQIADQLTKNNLKQVLFNLPAGNWGAGERGITCLPDRVHEFQDGVNTAMEYAEILECKQLNALAGIPLPGSDLENVKQTFTNNLEFAANKLQDKNIYLLTEPINTIDIPGFYLNYTEQAKSILGEVNSNNLYIQYDVYHMQIMEGDLIRTIKNNLEYIKHIQIADNPGRHEPGTGEINYSYIFEALQLVGYNGYIGCEYIPLAKTLDGIGWIKQYRQ